LKTEYQKDLNYCKQFIFSFGSNYSLGTRLFTKDVRESTIFFYAFVRYADELVDNPDQKMPGQTHTNLDEFMTEWKNVLETKNPTDAHPILRSVYYLFTEKNIPFDYLDDFFTAMHQDTKKSRYKTYVELEHYMWGSATIVGHVMTFVVGYLDQDAFTDAKALAEAMQLANFIRDIDEDYQGRDRIYIPETHMATFAVNEKMIAGQTMTPQLRNLLVYYIEFTEKLFTQGIHGIKKLQSGKFSILLASRMYRENIRILKRRGYDIFAPKIRLSKIQKARMLVETVFMYPFWLLGNIQK
jgi:phytoene synthase